MVSDYSDYTSRSYKRDMLIEDWIDELENYLLARHGDVNNDRKKAAVITYIGNEGRAVIRNLAQNKKDTYPHLVDALKEHFQPGTNAIVERNTFFNMYSEEDELVEAFLTRLRTQAAKCDFRIQCRPATNNDAAVHHDLTDIFLRDRLVVGWSDVDVRRRLMRERELTLENAIDIIKATETANRQIKMLIQEQKNGHQSISVNAIKKKLNRQNFQNFRKPQKPSEPQNVKGQKKLCMYCGKRHLKGNCPAYGKVCHKCKKKNHFSSVCKAEQRVDAVDEYNGHYEDDYEYVDEYSYPGDNLYLGEITAVSRDIDNSNEILYCDSINSKDWLETLKLNNQSISAKIDTGAQANIMSKSVYNKYFPEKRIDRQCKVKLYAYGGTNIPSIGKVKFVCQFENKKVDTEFIIVPLDVKTVLGLDSCIKIGLVRPPDRHSKAQPQTMTDTDQYCSDKLKLKDKDSKAKTLVDRQQTTGVFSEATDKRTVNSDVKQDTVNKPPGQTDMTESVKRVKQTVRNGVKANPSLAGLAPVLETYADVFDDSTVGCLKNYEYDIKLKENSVPVVHAARKIALTLVDDVKTELDRMERLGVIAKVDKPTDWVNSMVIVQTPGKMRICLDPNDLNKCVKREYTSLPTIDEVLSKISGAKVFTKIDAKDGYWQIPLTEKSSFLTVFNTPHGRYRYTRLPFGLNSANEIFQKRMTQALENLDGVIVMYDDILICGRDMKEHDERLEKVLERARNAGLRLNLKKCKFRTDELKYVGHVVTKDGLKADPDKVSDILKMPKPEDKAGVQRLLGSLNFLSKYIRNLSELTAPIRQLLVKNVHFSWSYEQDKALEEIKKVLTNAPVLGFYDVKKDVVLTCDASSSGLGACIMQENRPIAYASRSLTETQLSYAQMEKELLAIVFGAERFSQYIYGKEVTVLTDHKPLLSCLKKPVHKSPVRIQRLLLRLQRYNLKLQYVPGKYMYIPDMLSRAYVTDNKQTDSERVLEKEAEIMIHSVIRNINCSDLMRDKIINETENDTTLSQIKFYIHDGWPDKIADCSEIAKPYWPIRAHLVYLEGLILYLDRIVIPKSLRTEILNRIHEGHQGRERCKILARKSVYWNGMNADIDKIVEGCEPCLLRRNRPSREPLQPHSVPNRAWQKVAIDLFTIHGIRYQLIVDFFSKWIELSTVPYNATSKDVIKHLKLVFSRLGIPETIFSDGDPIYTSREFNKFCSDYEMNHDYSSAGYPKSNGQVERKIQHVKNIIFKCHNDGSELELALLQYRNTPLNNDIDSPAMLLMNRRLRTKLPCISSFLNTKHDSENRISLKSAQEKSKMFYDRNTVKERRMFKNSELIRYRDNLASSLWKPGQIIRTVNPRSYELVNSNGNVIRRNSSLLVADKTRRCHTAVPSDDVFKMNKPNPTQHIPLRSSENPSPQVSRSCDLPTPGSKSPVKFIAPRRSERLKMKASNVNTPVLRRSERIKERINFKT